MGGFKLSYNEIQFLIYLYKWINNPNSHRLMLNVLQVKHPKIAFIPFGLLLSQAMKKTKSRHKKLLSIHHNSKLICFSIDHLLDRKQINWDKEFFWFYLISANIFPPKRHSQFNKIQIKTTHYKIKLSTRGVETVIWTAYFNKKLLFIASHSSMLNN